MLFYKHNSLSHKPSSPFTKKIHGLIRFRTYLLFGTLISNEVRNVVFEQVDVLFGCIFVIDLEVTSSSDA